MNREQLYKINKIINNSKFFNQDKTITNDDILRVLKKNPKFCSKIKKLFTSDIITKEILDKINNSDISDYTKRVILLFIHTNDYLIADNEEINDENNEEINDIETDTSEEYYGDDLYIRYLCDIKKFHLLTPEEEKNLFIEYKKTKDLKIRDEIVNSNLRLVIHFAKKINCDNLSLLDKIQEGNMGLLTAIDKFDVDKGFKFSTYASFWIVQYIKRARADKDNTIRIPVEQYDRNQKIQRKIYSFVQEHGKQPTYEELAEITGLSLEEIKSYYLNKRECISYNISKSRDDSNDDFTLLDQLPYEVDMTEELYHEEMKSMVEKALEELKISATDRYCNGDLLVDVLKKRAGIGIDEPMTLAEIGEEKNLSKERIRQIEAKAKKLLKRIIEEYNK